MNAKVMAGRVAKKVVSGNPWVAKADEPTRTLFKKPGAQLVYVGFLVAGTSEETDVRVRQMINRTAKAKAEVCEAIGRVGGSWHEQECRFSYIAARLTKKQAQKLAEVPEVRAIRENERFLGVYRGRGVSCDLYEYEHRQPTCG